MRDATIADDSILSWPTFWRTDHKLEEWLLDPLLPRGRYVSLYAEAKSGKSLLALELAVKLALGERVLDTPSGKPVTVLYVDMEMTESDLKERLISMGYGPDHDLSSLLYMSLPRLRPLDTEEGANTFLDMVQQLRPSLVIFDTVSRVVAGKENESDTWRDFFRLTGSELKAMGCTVLRLDHTGKSTDKGAPKYARGSSAKNDDVDLAWKLTATSRGGVTLQAELRRQGWIPERVELLRLSDPLRHERAAQTWNDGAREWARILDDLGVDPSLGRDKVRAFLKGVGRPGPANDVLSDAIKYRKAIPEPVLGQVAADDPLDCPGTGGDLSSGTASGQTRTGSEVTSGTAVSLLRRDSDPRTVPAGAESDTRRCPDCSRVMSVVAVGDVCGICLSERRHSSEAEPQRKFDWFEESRHD